MFTEREMCGIQAACEWIAGAIASGELSSDPMTGWDEQLMRDIAVKADAGFWVARRGWVDLPSADELQAAMNNASE